MLKKKLLEYAENDHENLIKCVLKNTNIEELHNCTEMFSSQNFSSHEDMFSTTLKDHLEKIKKKGFLIGQDGEIVYPKKSSKTYSAREDIPNMKKDVLMLAQDYIDKKTRKPITLEGRSEDAKLAKELEISQPPQGWWMSEKFDGERALWDGKHMVSRGGKVIWIPEWFKALLPPGESLDGELFIGRGKFQELGFLRSTVKPESQRKKNDNTVKDLETKWSTVLFMIFDIPHLSNLPWEERMKRMDKIVLDRCNLWKHLELPPYLNKPRECPLKMTKFIKVENEEQLDKYFNTLLSKDAEGVMLRAPNSPYKPKRTRFLLKVKPDHDAECEIVGYKPGTGKYKDVLGSFECKMIPEGKRFYISGMTDEIRKTYLKTHPIGTIVTYKYTFLTDEGIPRHPRYLRIRRNI